MNLIKEKQNQLTEIMNSYIEKYIQLLKEPKHEFQKKLIDIAFWSVEKIDKEYKKFCRFFEPEN